MTGDTNVLVLSGVVVRFGGLVALDIDEIAVPHNAVVGIVGANGAGKTTLLDVISGFVRPEAGSVRLDDKVELLGARPQRRAQLGIIRSFQAANLFESMTVSETVAVACQGRLPTPGVVGSLLGGPWSRAKERRVRNESDQIIDQMGLGRFYDKTIADLSTGTRRIVDLACAVAHRPRVLLLDEPGAGVAQSETDALGRLILEIRDSLACTLIIIEHDIPLLRKLSDVMYALEVGQVIAHGSPDVVLSDPHVVSAYLGTSETAIARSGAAVGPATGKASPV